MAAAIPLSKLVVVGVGLIGGSFAMALRQGRMVSEVVGMGRSAARLDEALNLGVIDRKATEWADALRGADFVFIATPVGQMESIMGALAPYLDVNTLITDGGSTKQNVVAAAYRQLGPRISRFVPSHPIAGAERSGVGAATAGLYRGKRVVMTPLAENRREAVARVRDLWEACGARVIDMAPEEHDRVFAAVSHLPHLLAFGLVHDLAQRYNAQQLFGFAASGFRDFTRIAGSHPEMWRDICVANREALLVEIDLYLAELARLRELVSKADGARLEVVFERARKARDIWAATTSQQP